MLLRVFVTLAEESEIEDAELRRSLANPTSSNELSKVGKVNNSNFSVLTNMEIGSHYMNY